MPLSWLLQGAETRGESDFWEHIESRLNKFPDKLWAQKTLKMTKDNPKQLGSIYRGLLCALQLNVVALVMPDEAILSISEQERATEANESKEDISNVEHLFQRLNRNGTRLDGEELAYSMIKAYLPELETPIAAICNKKEYMPASPTRLVALGIRAALAEYKVPGAVSVSAIRAIVRPSGSSEKHERINRFFGETDDGELGKVCQLVHQWLVFRDGRPFGLPPVLRTSIAQGSPDVYLLLMLMARKVLAENGGTLPDGNASDLLQKCVVGFSTALHWFGDRKFDVVEFVYNEFINHGMIDDTFFKGLLAKCYILPNNKQGLIPLPTPDALSAYLTLPGEAEGEALKGWRWSSLIKENEGRDQLWPALERIRNQRELLLYAQRQLILKRFKDYDPTRQDLWKSHNRPWDFDHILASALLSGNRGEYRVVSQQLASCIGNLRAWPFEDNRSDSYKSANEKIRTEEELAESLIEGFKELEAFSFKRKDVRYPHKPAAFVAATRDRLLRIYKDWYDTLEIGFMLG